jgi:hypothetical protein
MSTDGKVIRQLIGEFLAYSLEHGGTEITDEAMRVARQVAAQEPSRIATWLLHEIPEFVEQAEEPVEMIQHALAGGALVVRHLLEQSGADVDRAQSIIYLFTQEFCCLFLGVAMKHQWIKKHSEHPLFEGGR